MQETSINPFFVLPKDRFLKKAASVISASTVTDDRFGHLERKRKPSILADSSDSDDKFDLVIVDHKDIKLEN